MAEESQNSCNNKKNFRWNEEMIDHLINSLHGYKVEMEFKGIDFDADRPMQYKNLRIAMAKRYNDGLFFGPVSAPEQPENFHELSAEE